MEKIDLRKTLLDYYKATPRGFSLINLASFNYFMVDGQGDPNTNSSYVEAIELLYGVSYTLKFMSKNELDRDYVVPPLEGLWWADDMNTFITREKSKWNWTMMVMIPEGISKVYANSAIKAFNIRKPEIDVSKIRFDSFKEGLCVQILHIGPYDQEGQVLEELHKHFMPENKLAFNGKHHEIYLGDPRKSRPEKLKTILRQPVVRVK